MSDSSYPPKLPPGWEWDPETTAAYENTEHAFPKDNVEGKIIYATDNEVSDFAYPKDDTLARARREVAEEAWRRYEQRNANAMRVGALRVLHRIADASCSGCRLGHKAKNYETMDGQFHHLPDGGLSECHTHYLVILEIERLEKEAKDAGDDGDK